MNIILIFKSGTRSKVENYRPISILPSLSKIFEKIVHKRLSHHVSNVISTNQHGFVPGRSCVTNLSILMKDLLSAVNSKSQCDIIYTDFAKAFDSINHSLLLHKLTSFGVQGTHLKWFRSYLNDRLSRVIIKNAFSEWTPIVSGVPQGSHLGPLLFNLFINDICDNLVSNSLLFADDMKIYRIINSDYDSLTLQSDINRIVSWSDTWLLSLNPTKCKVLTVSLKRNVLTFPYKLNTHALSRVNSMRDLGVIIDQKLNFCDHVDSMIQGARKTLGFIMRNSYSINSEHVLKLLYYTMVRSKLEYASVIWNGISKHQSDRIERVQHKFLTFLHKRTTGFYSDDINLLCNIYHLQSLKSRRAIFDNIFLYKCINGKFNVNVLTSYFGLHVPRFLTRHAVLFHVPFGRVNCVRDSLFSRIPRQFNLLLKDHNAIDPFTVSLDSFKNLLKLCYVSNC